MSALGRFLDWWGRELGAVLSLGRERRGPVLLARAGGEDEGPVLELRRGRSRHALGPLGGVAARELKRLQAALRERRLTVLIGVAESASVRRTTTLPAAVREDLEGALRFEVERLTPFRADEVFFTARILEERSGAGQLEIEMVFVPRRVVEPLRAALGEAGLAAGRIDLVDAEGALAGLDLMPAALRPRPARGRAYTAAAMAAAMLLALLWSGAALLERSRAVADLREAVTQARRMAVAAEDARVASSGGDAASLAAFREKRDRPLAIEVLARLTEAVPDGTWIETLSLAGRELELSGVSDDAAGLIARLERDPGFEGAAFRAPITRIAESGRKRFALRLRLTAAPARAAER
ncbi:MAG: PilN domain-containing protein [Pseudomonadota bacterium]